MRHDKCKDNWQMLLLFFSENEPTKKLTEYWLLNLHDTTTTLPTDFLWQKPWENTEMATCGKERETDFPRTLKKKKHAYYGNSDAPDSGIFCETLAKLSVSLDSGKHLGVNNPRNNNWKQEERQPNFHWIGEIYISAYKIKEITIWFCQNLWILGLRVTLNRTVTYCTCLKWFAII